MAGFGSFIPFHNGEGLDEADLDNLQGHIRRVVFDELMSMLGGMVDVVKIGAGTDLPGRTTESTLRPMGRSLCPRVAATGLVVDMDPGLVLAHLVADDLDDTSLIAENLAAYQKGLSVTLETAHATLWRRDLIEARVLEVEEGAISRDFKDDTTGALSSTTFVKRTNTVVQVQKIDGATQASAPAADLLAAEPVVTAGWFKVGTVRVDPTATDLDQDTLYDWRKPMGYGGGLVQPNGFSVDITAAGDHAWHVTGGSNILRQDPIASATPAKCYPFHQGPFVLTSAGEDLDSGTDHFEDHRRMAMCSLETQFDGVNALAADFGAREFANGLSGFTGLDVSARIPTGASSNTIYSADDFPNASLPFNDLPIWANGRNSPAADGAGGRTGVATALEFTLIGPDDTTTFADIHALFAQFWGGLG